MLQKFIDLISEIVKRPAMFKVNRIEDIHLICFGYKSSLEGNGREELSNFLLEFRGFVNKRFESENDHDWDKVIRFYSASDIHSISLFSDVFNQFCKGISVEIKPIND